MKNLISLKSVLTSIIIFIAVINVNGQINSKLPNPQIKAGIANISGSISHLNLPKGEKKVSISFVVYNPVSGEESKFTTRPNNNNRFSINIPLECTTALAGFAVESENFNHASGMIGVNQVIKSQLNIDFNKEGTFKVNTTGGINISSDESIDIIKAIGRFEDKVTWGAYYKMTPKEFSQHELIVSLTERINFALDSLKLSEGIKKYLINTFNLRYLKGRLFYYKETAEKSHLSANDSIVYTAVEPDKSYYSFLKSFNLNDPQFLYAYSYTGFMRKLFAIEALKIPLLNDKPINNWLAEVKSNLKDIVGFDSGLFYDMLAATAYSHQMNERMEPLTKVQIENIKNYFKTNNKGITAILLKNNEEVIKTLEKNRDLKIRETPTVSVETTKDTIKTNNLGASDTLIKKNEMANEPENNKDLKIKETSSVSIEKLMETIIANYKGKVVLVDLWATWCGPCKQGIKEMKPLKAELKDKDVVFVYLSNVSSPRIRWEYEIKAIGGEQYYLQAKEWEYIMDSFGFSGIPSYLIYDRNGALKHQFTGFPGVDKMREMIDELLPKK